MKPVIGGGGAAGHGSGIWGWSLGLSQSSLQAYPFIQVFLHHMLGKEVSVSMVGPFAVLDREDVRTAI